MPIQIPRLLPNRLGEPIPAAPGTAAVPAPPILAAPAGLNTSQDAREPAKQSSTQAKLNKLLLQREHTVRAIKRKGDPYPSTNCAPRVELNQKVIVARGAFTDSKELVKCRHLAYEFATSSGKASKLMRDFSTEEDIRRTFNGRWEEVDTQFHQAVRHAPQNCKHVVRSDQFGNYLKALATALNDLEANTERVSANVLLITHNHAEAVQVEKNRKSGTTYFTAKLYDPNNTASYYRVEKLAPEDLGSVQMKDMLDNPDDAFIDVAGTKQPLSMVAVSLDHSLCPDMSRSDVTPSADNMQVALGHGAHSAASAMIDTFHKTWNPENGNAEQSRQFFILLEATSSAANHLTPDIERVSGFFMTLQYGHAETAKWFIKTVLTSRLLDENQKSDLLAARRSDGMPGLTAAFITGQAETVQTFTNSVLDSDLSPEKKTELLAGNCPVVGTCLSSAFEDGDSATVLAFTESVLASGLSPDEKTALLTAHSLNHEPGLRTACEKGHMETAEAFAAMVQASTLDEDNKTRLLAPMRDAVA